MGYSIIFVGSRCDLFEFFNIEHGLILTDSEIDDIIDAVKTHLENDNKTTEKTIRYNR